MIQRVNLLSAYPAQYYSYGNIDFGNKVVASVARNGDLIHQIILEVDLPQLTTTKGTISWVNSIGFYIRFLVT